MRPRKRIDVYINLLTEEVLHRLFIHWFNTNFEEAEHSILKNKRKIKKFWHADHDLRLSQVLINMGFIENYPGIWYYEEDNEALISAGCEPREVLFWGQCYDKDMKRLPETNWILIKDMTTDHIRAVISYMEERNRVLSPLYQQAFENELNLRKE
jgi:hypothetical protein